MEIDSEIEACLDEYPCFMGWSLVSLYDAYTSSNIFSAHTWMGHRNDRNFVRSTASRSCGLLDNIFNFRRLSSGERKNDKKKRQTTGDFCL